MKISNNNLFKSTVAEYGFIAHKQKAKKHPIFTLLKVLRILKSFNLLNPQEILERNPSDKNSFQSYEINDDLEEMFFLLKKRRKSSLYIRIYGTGYIVGEGIYQNPIWIDYFQDDDQLFIDVSTSMTSWLEFDMKGQPQKNYIENSIRFYAAIDQIRESLEKSREEWFLSLEPTIYADTDEETGRIFNHIDEYTDQPLDVDCVVGGINYEPPIDSDRKTI